VRIAVVGGGVGGLAAAIALRRAGCEVSLFERAASVRAEGGAFVLWSNGLTGVRQLGLEAEALAAGTTIHCAEFRDAAGNLLTSLPVGEVADAIGAPTIVIPRASLVRILRRALPQKIVHTGWQVVDFREHEDAIELQFERGAARSFDALVGADGLRSTVRERMFGEEALRPAGQVAWVGICRFKHPLCRLGVTIGTLGRGPRFWIAPMRKGRVYWYATLRESGRSARRITSRSELAACFREWHAPIASLIAATADSDIVVTRIADRPPRAGWSRGRATLLGDAAHPTTPDLGQGACQAIESAVTLGEALGENIGPDESSIARAFAQYETKRFARTCAINQLSSTTARTSTVDDPLLATLRDTAIRVGLRALGRAQLRWLLDIDRIGGGAP
jgi:2-polyprenyl-6-methoxyphenol hydroxylase-like FAD-dependent oxidoreductase